jgi:hypothetical protein
MVKIFSLETKKHLVGWSVVVGVILALLINKTTFRKVEMFKDGGSFIYKAGWPVEYQIFEPHKLLIEQQADAEAKAIITNKDQRRKGYWNFFIWIVTVFVILSLIRHYRKQNIGISSVQS